MLYRELRDKFKMIVDFNVVRPHKRIWFWYLPEVIFLSRYCEMRKVQRKVFFCIFFCFGKRSVG